MRVRHACFMVGHLLGWQSSPIPTPQFPANSMTSCHGIGRIVNPATRGRRALKKIYASRSTEAAFPVIEQYLRCSFVTKCLAIARSPLIAYFGTI